MALQTSGAISMANLVSEFGGVGSDSISEYYVLAGMGVSGIPSSGSISFSHFHGKSKNVTTSVWTTSGYNSYSTSIANLSTSLGMWTHRSNGNNYMQLYGTTYLHITSITYQGIYYDRGSRFGGSNNGNNDYYYMRKHSQVATWHDTSAYVDTATIASITT